MSHYPEVQQKARAELDAVVGRSRLPTPVDRSRLPYVDAVVKEALRWHCATPLLIPHFSTADDHYNGFYIPENSVVLVNAWCVLCCACAGPLNFTMCTDCVVLTVTTVGPS